MPQYNEGEEIRANATGATGTLPPSFAVLTATGSSGAQSVPVGAPVRFTNAPIITSDYTFNGSNTLTIINPGVYVVDFNLCLDAVSISPNIFSVTINGLPLNFTSTVNTVGGQISFFTIIVIGGSSNIQIVNNSTVAKSIVNPIGNGGIARECASLIIYRIQ